MDQRTNDWHSWRAQGIGSSDAAAIMGASPWKTKLELWEEKVGLSKPDSVPNFVMQRGIDMEPKARAAYEILHEMDMPATLAQHQEYPFLRASLDGYNHDSGIVLEIKCPGAEDHARASDATKPAEERIPEKYLWQLYHQLIVTGAGAAHYWSYDGEKGVLVELAPNADKMRQLFDAEVEFWKMVQEKKAPELSERDFKKIRDKEMVALFEAYKAADLAEKAASEQKAIVKEMITSKLPNHPRILCGGVRVVKSIRQGKVQYAKIPELKGVDLDKYRGKPSEVLTFAVLKEETA